MGRRVGRLTRSGLAKARMQNETAQWAIPCQKRWCFRTEMSHQSDGTIHCGLWRLGNMSAFCVGCEPLVVSNLLT